MTARPSTPLRAATRANLRLLAMVRRRALDATPPVYDAAIRATQAMQAIMEREVSVGQSLGEYRRVATERAAPTNDEDQRPNLVG